MVEKIGAKLVTTEEAIRSSNIIVMAVPKNFYERQPLHLLEGKTVIGKKHALKKYDQFGLNTGVGSNIIPVVYNFTKFL